MNVQQLRDILPVTNNTIYMNTGWAGPTPETVLKRIAETLEEEARLGPTSNNWLDVARNIRDEAISLVAKQLNASTDEITLTHSTREGLNAIIFGMNWQNSDEILICDLEHPALTTPASVLNERYGVTVNSVAIGATDTPSEIVQKVKSAITSKTKLIALSHIQYTCGLVMPIKEIATNYYSRPEGSKSKLNTYSDGLKILFLIIKLFRLERPLAFFTLISLVLAILSLILGLPVLKEYIEIGLVPKLPTAILAMGIMILSMLSLATGLILENLTRARLEIKRLFYLGFDNPNKINK